MPDMFYDSGLRRTIRLVAFSISPTSVLSLLALAISSVSLFADGVDFLEDTSVNFLILVALGWSARRRAKVGMGLAAILLAPGLRDSGPRGCPPIPEPGCSVADQSWRPCSQSLLRGHADSLRRHRGSLTKAFLGAK